MWGDVARDEGGRRAPHLPASPRISLQLPISYLTQAERARIAADNEVLAGKCAELVAEDEAKARKIEEAGGVPTRRIM